MKYFKEVSWVNEIVIPTSSVIRNYNQNLNICLSNLYANYSDGLSIRITFDNPIEPWEPITMEFYNKGIELEDFILQLNKEIKKQIVYNEYTRNTK